MGFIRVFHSLWTSLCLSFVLKHNDVHHYEILLYLPGDSLVIFGEITSLDFPSKWLYINRIQKMTMSMTGSRQRKEPYTESMRTSLSILYTDKMVILLSVMKLSHIFFNVICSTSYYWCQPQLRPIDKISILYIAWK